MRSANTVFGKSSGRLAGVVASTWKGINVVREKPLSVNQPNTEAQLNQRARMAKAVSLQKINLAFLNVCFKERAVRMSAYNAAISALLPAITATGGVATLGPVLAGQLAQGSLTGVVNLTGAYVSDTTTHLTWSDNSNGSTILATDRVRAVTRDDNGLIVYSSNDFARSAGSGTFTFPGAVVNIGDKVYTYCTRTSEGKASDNSGAFTVTA